LVTDQIVSGLFAVAIGLVLSVVAFVPFVALTYRQHGRLTATRAFLSAGFLIYCLALWTYTLMPFPDPSNLSCSGHNLRLLQFIDDIRRYDTSSLAGLLRNPAFLQVALNVVLFVPLGFGLRLLWRRGVVFATILGLAISGLIETTQLTGVWGLYPCAYRVFDVDDLLANTAGALIGGVLSWPAGRIIHIDGRTAPVAAHAVTGGRRLIGMVCDWLVLTLCGAGAGIAVRAWQLYGLGLDATDASQRPVDLARVGIPFVLGLVITLATARTPGDLAVELRFAGPNGTTPALWRRLIRFIAGIGGYQLLTLPDLRLDLIFLVASLIAVVATKHRGGLPAVLSGLSLVGESAPRRGD
jgi:glycopeptide antibiotics resistance protein